MTMIIYSCSLQHRWRRQHQCHNFVLRIQNVNHIGIAQWNGFFEKYEPPLTALLIHIVVPGQKIAPHTAIRCNPVHTAA